MTESTKFTISTILKILIIVLLLAVCYQIFYKTPEYNNGKTQYLEDEMSKYQHKFDSILNASAEKIDISIQKQNELIDNIKKYDELLDTSVSNLLNEKLKLQNATNDENIIYFRNYLLDSNSK